MSIDNPDCASDDISYYGDIVGFWSNYSLELLRKKRVMWADAFKAIKYLQEAEHALERSLFYRQRASRERLAEQQQQEKEQAMFVLTDELLVSYAVGAAECALLDLQQVGIAANAVRSWGQQCEAFYSFAWEVLRRRREACHA